MIFLKFIITFTFLILRNIFHTGFWGFGVLGFGILTLIWIWSLVFGTPICQILALYLDFAGAKNINVL